MAGSILVPLPLPQKDFDSRGLPLVRKSGAWFRIARHDFRHLKALHFGKSASCRFDDPQQRFGVLYAARTMGGAFAEVFIRNPSPSARRIIGEADLANKSMIELQSAELTLVDLTARGLARLGVDISLLSTRDYLITQAWSAAFHSHPQKPDGIYYRSRHDPAELCVAIFQRSRRKVSLTCCNPLDSAEGLMLIEPARDKYGVGYMVRTAT